MNIHNLQVIPPNLHRKNKQLFFRNLLKHSDQNKSIMNDLYEQKDYKKSKFKRIGRLYKRQEKIKSLL